MSSHSTNVLGSNVPERDELYAYNYKAKLEEDVFAAVSKPTPLFYIALLTALGCVGIGATSWAIQIINGLGKAGIMNPVGWGVYITDFVFWVGIAHSGTLISAILFLFRAKFRNRFNRTAEAMTVFAVLTAGLFPLIHLGRVWFFYWLFPYPNQRHLWVNFKSPLVWDVFAVSTYLTVSVVFWYIGLVPDLAIARRIKESKIAKTLYGIFSLGWTGTFKEWQHYNQLYKFLAALATPLVLSVHSVVSWDFAMGVVYGWHTTIFAPYFVAGAIFSGCAMVITLMVPMRKMFRLERYIAIDDFEKLAKLLMLTGLIVSYAYIVELALALYVGKEGNVFEYEQFMYRLTGDYAWAYWTMILCNVISPLTLFVRKLRRNLIYLFVLSIPINIGMWFERFNIIVISLARDFDPYAFGYYTPTWIEWGITLGSFGWFFTFFLLFSKTIPVLPVTELKEEVD
ncbi:MAG: polysulfide reductase NrfD [Calditrichaeota bacterium]|nr:polysulfide reductase NrfD [Calditrichota bacterium]MCB0302591.1 polysulfide reductase NrfD [Calditrichota bacterium]MCB9087561.1 polysulfide reductase NrfD [Calditrichia bacterium]